MAVAERGVGYVINDGEDYREGSYREGVAAPTEEEDGDAEGGADGGQEIADEDGVE